MTRGEPGWEKTYGEQRAHRGKQLEAVTRFAEAPVCRMLQFVRHFGDQEDSGAPGGQCDVCAPDACLVARSREPGQTEARHLEEILAALRVSDGQAVGRLYRERFEGAVERRAFEGLLAALARSGRVRIEETSFEKEGREIPYRRLYLSGEALRSRGGAVGVRITEAPAPKTKRRRKTAADRSRTARRARSAGASTPETEAPKGVVAALREWRLAEARRRGIPAFRVLPDRTLAALAAAGPESEAELLAVRGFGPTLLRKYGTQILRVLRQNR